MTKLSPSKDFTAKSYGLFLNKLVAASHGEKDRYALVETVVWITKLQRV